MMRSTYINYRNACINKFKTLGPDCLNNSDLEHCKDTVMQTKWRRSKPAINNDM